MVKTIISGGKIYAEQGVLTNAMIGIVDKKIFSFEKMLGAEVITFPESYHIVPGFIDLHIHGAKGCDVMDATISSLEAIASTIAAEGTTAFLATTMTAAAGEIESALCVVRDAKKKLNTGAKLLGVHLEGPFLSSNKVGAQRADKILLPDVKLIQRWQNLSENCIKLVTLAPELKNSCEFIRFLTQQNIIASIGHSDATYAETCEAIAAGCSHVTHLFNAMRGIHQREPGVVTAALLSEKVSTELIVDGIHLHSAIIELVLRVKDKEKIILVTDAMRASCMSDGYFDLGGQRVNVKNGVAKLDDGTLAGSTLTMSDAIRNMLEFTQCSLADVIAFAAENPAKTLGIFDCKGSLREGKDADIVVLDEQYRVVLTMCEGEVVFVKDRSLV